ncbi:MAG: glycosyl transferase family 1, partial [Nitrosomonadaceae bacterium]|nr:glycosyl transferase family 1 [Nitrosomonadaceae bacterium]
MIKVMGLALYGDKAASTRYRLFQYKSLLEESGIELEVFSLLSNEYLVKKFNGERISLIDILVSVFNRIKILL